MSLSSKIINTFVRPEFLKLQPYPATLTLEQLAAKLKIPKRKIVKLNTAENSAVAEFYLNRIKNTYYSYPDPYSVKLRQAIGRFIGFSPEWIVCGNGSDELIDLLIALFVSQSEQVLLCPPTFPMYEFCCAVRGVKIKKVPRNKSLNINFKKLISVISNRTKLVFIDSPGNPTGKLLDEKQLIILLQKKIIVVVDEAYFEYSGQTVASLIKRYPNLVVIRSFSKWAGLAGLRLGYLIANPEVIKIFLLIKPPYNVNSVAQEVGLLASRNRKQIIRKLQSQLAIKKIIVKELRQFKNLKIEAGQGSYILLQVLNANRDAIISKLKKRGILVKPINQPQLTNSFLVSLESRPKMNKLIKVLKQITKE